jgi:peptidoglycan/LPS O-acetylase OafA/YrhL
LSDRPPERDEVEKEPGVSADGGKTAPGEPKDAIHKQTKPESYKVDDVHDHLIELDALRGIAILGVVIAHVTGQWQIKIGDLPIPGLGWNFLETIHFIRGVPLFYLLSGYLLTWTEGSRAARGTYSLRSYAKRRILRLVPAYYVSLLIVVLIWPTRNSFWDVVSHLTFLHGLTPYYGRTMNTAFWSLTPEVIFYLILPLFVLKLTGLWQRVAAFVILLLASFPLQLLASGGRDARFDAQYESFNPFQFYSSFPLTLLYLFIAGMLLRMLVEHLNGRPTSPWQPRIALVLFVGCLAWTVTTPGLGILRLGFLGETGLQIESLIIRDAALIGLFASALLGAPGFRHLLKWRVLSFIGLISYSMFVFHQTILKLVSGYFLREPAVVEWVKQSLLTQWVGFGVFVLVMAILIGIASYLGYRFIESPFLRRKPK